MKCVLKQQDCHYPRYFINFECGIISIPNHHKTNVKEIKTNFENIKKFKNKINGNDDCGIDNIMMDESLPFSNWESYYLYFGRKSMSFHFHNCWPEQTQTLVLSHSTSIIDKNNNQIEICVEYIIDSNEYYLYFIKNDNILGKDKTKTSFINGKVKLDFDNNDYLFALSSSRCDCDERKNVKGIEFEVSVTTTAP